MHLKAFTRYYQLHLLPVSHVGMALGDLVWKRKWGGNRMVYKGMGKNIFNRLHDADLLNQEQWKNTLKQLKTPPCELAALAQLEIGKVNKARSIFLQQIQPEIKLKKIISMKIEKVCVRILPNELRMNIDRALEPLSSKALRQLLGRPKRVHLISELYYGQLKMTLEKEVTTSLSLSDKGKNLPLDISKEGNTQMEYQFSTPEVPFAYRMEALEKFNA